MYDRPPASDDAELEQLLRDGLGDVGARGGKLGGPTAKAGGRLGAKLSAALLPVRHHEEALELLSLSLEEAARLAEDVLAPHGRTIPQRTARKAVRKVIESLELAYRAAPPS